MPESSEKFLQKTGNYRALHAYRKAEVLYDYTFRFCEKFLAKGDRTRDQMIQAARSENRTSPKAAKTNYLLDQLVRRLETDFVQKGGLRERMTRARLNHRESRR